MIEDLKYPPVPDVFKNIVIDIDGVLTDNKVWYDHQGQRTKGFNSSDIWAIRELISMGYYVVIVTASSWPGATHYVKRTGADLRILRDKSELELDNFICVVNDVWDIPLIEKSVKAYCPIDAHHAIKFHEKVTVLQKRGGEGVISLMPQFGPQSS